MTDKVTWGDIPYKDKLKLLGYYDKWVETKNRKYELKIRWKGYNTETLKRRLRELRSTLNEENGESEIYDDAGPFTEQVATEEYSVNEKVINARNSRIWTVEQLLTAMDISLEEWEITKVIGNKWEGYRKNQTKEIIWEDGKIVKGEISDKGNLFTAPLIQVKVWLVRKEPIAVKPVVSPVVITGLSDYLNKDRYSPPTIVKSALIIPDNHFGFSKDIFTGKLNPFHDRLAHDIVLQIANAYAFDKIIFLGDFLDLANWSDRFLRSPEFYFSTQAALIEAAWWLSQFRISNPQADMYLIEGNHDNRFESKIMMHVAEGYQLRAVNELDLPPSWSLPKLLNLESLNIEWIGDYPNGQVWLNKYLVAEHGSIAQGKRGTTAYTLNSKRSYSTIFGHVHGAEMVTRRVRSYEGTRTIFAMCPGFLGRMDGIIPGHKDNQEWSQGFAIAHYTDSDGPFDSNPQVTHIPIEDGEAIFDGNLWVGGDNRKALINFAGDQWGF